MQHDILESKIRSNLSVQKERLGDYLNILENEAADISNRDADKLESHVKLGSQILSEIGSYQKVLAPLQEMYDESPYKKDDGLDDLRDSIMSISAKVRQKSDENKRQLDTVMADMRTQMQSMPKSGRMRDAYSKVDSRFIDITL